MAHFPIMSKTLTWGFVVFLCLAGFILSSSYNYLLFHTLAEGFSIVVAFSIFMLAWNTRQFIENGYLQILGISFLFIGGLDGIHTLAYKGMLIFPDYDADLPTQLWIAARYIQSLSFLIAPLFLKKNFRFTLIFCGYAGVVTLLTAAIFTDMFPECFVEGSGLTGFKIVSEYLISGLLAASLMLLYRYRKQFDVHVLQLLSASLLLTIVSELAFTFYISVYGLSNLVGHLLKIVAFYLVYKAIISTGLTKPYQLLLRNLKQSEDSLQDILNSTQQSFVLIDRSYTISAYNRMADEKVQHFFGFPLQPGDSILRCVLERDRAAFIQHFAQALEGQTVTVQRPFHDQEGTLHWFSFTYNPVIAHDGQVNAVCLNIMENTTQKKAEEQLRQMWRRLEYLLNVSPAVIYTCQSEGNFAATFISENIQKLLGYDAYNFLEDPNFWINYIHPDDRTRVLQNLVHIFEKGQYSHEYRFLHKNGTYRWILDDLILTRDDRGQTIEMIGSLTDITERKEAEQALKESEEKFRTLAENLPDVIARFDRDFRHLYVNPAAMSASGLSVQEYLGKTNEELGMPPDLVAYWHNSLSKVFHTGQPKTLEFAFPTPDGIRYFHGRLIPELAKDGSVKSALGVLHDITEIKRTQEDLRHARDAAETANQAKSEFLANMSHEIRTPMNVILGFTEMLSALTTDAQQQNYLQAIQASGQNLLTIINDILDLSKIEAGKMEFHYEPVNLKRMCGEIQQMFAMNLSHKQLDFRVELDPELPDALLLDEVRLRQILFNVVGNAVKFTEEGQITFSLSGASSPNAVYTITLVVEDTGIGISPEFQATIFQAFAQQEQQLTRKYGGTGLGLTITKRLVEMMNGTIQMTSSPGKGSRFTITFHDVAVADSASRSLDLPKTSEDGFQIDPEQILFEPTTVLVADDVESNRMLIEAFLQENETIHVFEAENGEQAINIAEREQPDLIFMDLRMPVMSGYEAIKQIKCREKLAHIPVIALTASAMKRAEENVLPVGFDGYLIKPVRRAELFRELIRFLPHSMKETPTSRRPDMPQAVLSGELLQKHPEIRQYLEQKLTPLWEIARQNAIFDDIAQFAQQINEFGERYQLEGFKKFGTELLSHVQHFDVEQIESSLEMYPQMIGDLSK